MSELSRRNAVKVAATAGIVAVGTGIASADTKPPEGEHKPNSYKPITITDETPTVTVASDRVAFVTVPNGTLIKGLGVSPVWLILDGVRVGYTSRELYERVHKSDATIHEVLDPEAIQEVTPFGSDLELIKVPGNNPIFLLNHGRRRGFTSRAIFDRYQYDDHKVREVSAGVMAAIQEDPPIPE